ncbi:MAG: pitrilysin family protein [Candidatus Magasanikbacteria bacterium]|nr:pitrilysin family protein [Candidatus Magasanikbacteria bacterium]
MHRQTKLKNGLASIFVPISGTKAVTIMILLSVGSRYENSRNNGVSHFVEHLMFKGTKKRPTTQHISRELDSVGAQFNAFTGKEYTGYYVKIGGAKQELAMDVLSDMLYNSKFDEAEIKREKGVIMEEIKMYKDDPMSAVEDVIEKLMFGGHALGRNIAGTIQGIKQMSRADLWDYYRGAYAPKNMVLVAAGAINTKTKKLAEKYFGNYSAPVKIRKDDYDPFKKFINASFSKRVGVEKRKIDQAHVILAYPGLKKDDPKRYALAVLTNILGGGMSSRLFVEVRERRGLAYRIRAEVINYRDTGAVFISTGLDQNRLKEAFVTIEAQVKRIATELVSSKELADAKSNIAGHLTLAMENSHNQAQWFAENFLFFKKLESYEEAVAKIKKVTAKDVLNLAKIIFKPQAKRVAVISAKKKSQIIKSL